MPMEYGPDGLPLFYTTSKRDVQLWFKLMRKYCVPDLGRIRYFIVSEFGENTGRPHYHAIIFTDVRCSLEYMTNAVNKHWHKGYINDVQYLKGNGGLRYVANYITKALDCYKTFALMSRRPGLMWKRRLIIIVELLFLLMYLTMVLAGFWQLVCIIH